MKLFHHLMYIEMHVCVWNVVASTKSSRSTGSIHVARSLHVILCTTTLCPGAREQTGVAHIPRVMRFILVEGFSYVQTSKTVFLTSSKMILVKYPPWFLGMLYRKKESSCITEDSKSQVMEEPEMIFVFALRPASFPNTTGLRFVSMAFKICIGEIQENPRGLFLEHFKWFRVLTTKSKLTNVMPRVCTMHPA